MTSRNQHWPGNSLILDTFTPQEALIFVKNRLPDEEDKSIIKLSKDLYFFPLALNQATSYISEHTNIDEYLNLYVKHKKYYLNKFSGDRNQYEESLWTTWSIILPQLTNISKEILFISAYLYSDDIPIAFFDHLSIEKREEAIRDLRKYSLITLANHNKSFKVHRLLQEVMRMTVTDNSNSEKFFILNKAIKFLKNKFHFIHAKYDTWNLCEQYLMHAQSLAGYAIDTQDDFYYSIGVQLYAQVAMYLAYVQLNHEDAKRIFKKALELIKQHYYADKSYELALANICTHLGRIERKIGNIEHAKRYLNKANMIYESTTSSVSIKINELLTYLRWDHDLISEDGVKCDYSLTLHNLGQLRRDLADYKAAKYFYEKALAILTTCKHTNSTLIYKVLFLLKLGSSYIYYDGKVKEAEEILDIATKILNETFKDHLALMAYADLYIARLHYYVGEYDKAEKIANDSLNIGSLVYAKDHLNTLYVQSMLGLILCSSNHVTEGVALLKQTEGIYNGVFKEEHLFFTLPYICMHYAYEKYKQYDKALQYLTKAQKIIIKYWGGKSNIFLSHQFSPVEKLPFLEKSEKNTDYYAQTLNIVKVLFGETHIRTARYHYLFGQVLENVGNKKKAKLHYLEALNIANKLHFDSDILTTAHQANIKIIQGCLDGL